jgi:hypothetical protein
VGAASLLLVQPALEPGSYFEEIRAMARRASLGAGTTGEFAFGYPVPTQVPQSLSDVVSDELAEFEGKPAIAVHYESPAVEVAALDRFERIIVPGSFQFGLKAYQDLKEAAIVGLRRILGGDRA